ncbi:OB-fold protein [Enterobacter chengduensis]|uniref:OB-fold protein n=1 Tax=Enterobacter chengduensis TaxID=2494701 RepID=UPI0005F0526C|nr:hypothetical protein [Enterobacter chengduensis]KJL97806.1 hypothetical protein SS39_19445 [Enterobacter chengduensis]KJM07596.1 hypothetical protein SS50_02250 [Enterobacter chengduensis]
MNKLIVAALLSTFAAGAFAEVKPFTDDEAYGYLKPSDEHVYSNVINAMVRNDAEASLQLNKTEMGFDLTPHSVKKIVSDFEKNEIVATDNYANRAIRIKGIVKSIGLDAFKNGVITISGEKVMFGNLVASVDKSAEWVRKAGKGDKVDVICNISGYTMLNVAAKCDSALNVTKVVIKKEYGLGDRFTLPKSQSSAAIAIMIKMSADKLSEPCASAGNACLRASMSALDGKQIKANKIDPRLSGWFESLPQPPSGNTM